MKAASWIAAAIVLAGCAAAPAATAADAGEPLAWRAAPGGGQIAETAFATSTGGYRSATATRCWPAAGRQDCLSVYWTNTAGYSARRFTAAALPADRDALEARTGGPGYSCGLVPEHGLTTETIAGRRGTLAEHSWLAFAPKQPWTAAYVRGVSRTGAMDGSPWFRCVDLMRLLNTVGIDAVGTAAVSRKLLE